MGELKEVLGAAKRPGSLSIDGKGAFDRRSRLPDLREDSDKAKIPASVAKEIGRQIAVKALTAAAKKAATKLARGSRAWTKAFTHIAQHFNPSLFGNRVTHGVFVSALRRKDLLEPLIEETLKKGRRQITKAVVHDVAEGRPVVIIEREFEQIIGVTRFRRGEGVVAENCRILRVIVDVTGTPVTAYPVTEFLRLVAP